MAASYETIENVIKVIKNHVNEEILKAIVKDLLLIKGNNSFEESIKRISRKMSS